MRACVPCDETAPETPWRLMIAGGSYCCSSGGSGSGSTASTWSRATSVGSAGRETESTPSPVTMAADDGHELSRGGRRRRRRSFKVAVTLLGSVFVSHRTDVLPSKPCSTGLCGVDVQQGDKLECKAKRKKRKAKRRVAPEIRFLDEGWSSEFELDVVKCQKSEAVARTDTQCLALLARGGKKGLG